MLGIIIILFAIAIASLTMAIAVFSNQKKHVFDYPEFPIFFSVFIILTFVSFLLFSKYKQKVESNAILKYNLGEYETIEKSVNGEVVDRTYKLIKIDYD